MLCRIGKEEENHMIEQIYGWIRNITVYLIMMTAVMHLIPGKNYRKYIRFFSGLILVLLMFSPLMKMTGFTARFSELYESKEYEMEKREIEKAGELYDEIRLSDYGVDDSDVSGDETEKSIEGIEVEEISIGDE